VVQARNILEAPLCRPSAVEFSNPMEYVVKLFRMYGSEFGESHT
jgi:hypothetical protein